MILIDVNVLMYSFGKEHRYRQASVQILEDVARERLDANIDTEALQEILYVYSERGERARGLQVFDALLQVFPRPFPVGREDMLAARMLMGSYPSLRSRDAVHAGVVIRHNLEAIISADRAFDPVTEIRRVDPLEFYS